ncbi:MAG: dipeptidase [Bacteroidales bacterium]|nr:dipeptidase [Bacteroidales bacterium]
MIQFLKLILQVIILAVISFLISRSANAQELDTAIAMNIHDRVFTVDSHTDTPLRFLRTDFNIGIDNSNAQSPGKVDLPRMKQGGLDGVFLAIFLGQQERTEQGNQKAIANARKIFDGIEREISKFPEQAEITTSSKQAYELEKQGKRAIFIGIENGYAIGNDLELIEDFYNRGARYITLCHTRNNDICDSSNDTIEHGGLSSFGVDVVKEMNRVGMIIDVSHISDQAFYDVIKHSTKPVIASHSCARAICDNPRNMTDDMLKQLAENNGVVQMCILSDYVKDMEQNPKRAEAQNALRKKYRYFKDLSEDEMKQAYKDWHAIDELFPGNLATVSDVVDHIDHMVKIAGIDHVGMGTDFDGGGGVSDCYDVSQMHNITLELVKRGYPEDQIRKIWGANLMRVLDAQNKEY